MLIVTLLGFDAGQGEDDDEDKDKDMEITYTKDEQGNGTVLLSEWNVICDSRVAI